VRVRRKGVRLSPEAVALLVLFLGAAVAFTLIVVVMVDRSAAGPWPQNGGDGTREREDEER
jgi:hypothetical protein